MSTIDTTGTYLLTNGRAGPSKALSSASDPNIGFIAMKDIDGSPQQQWFFDPVPDSNKFRMHTVAKGLNASLDVLNNKGPKGSAFLHFVPTEDVSGQVWTFTPVTTNVFRLTNDFTGPTRPLGGFKSVPIARLINNSIGPNDAQLWTLSRFSSASAPPPSPTSSSGPSEAESPDPIDTTPLPSPLPSDPSASPSFGPAATSNPFPDSASISVAAVALTSPSATAAAIPSSTNDPNDDPDNDPDNDPDSPDFDPDVSPGGSEPGTPITSPPASLPSASARSTALAPSGSTTALTAGPTPHRLSPEATAAIVIGSVLLFCALAVGAYFGGRFLRRKLQEHMSALPIRLFSRPSTPEMTDGFGVMTSVNSNNSTRRVDLDTTAVSQQSMMLFGVPDSRNLSSGEDVEVGRVIPSVSDGSSVSFRWDRRSYAHF